MSSGREVKDSSKDSDIKNVLQKVRGLELRKDVVTERPADSFTVDEYRAEFNLGERQAFSRIKDLLHADKVRRVKYFNGERVVSIYVLQEVEGASNAK